MPTKLNNSLAVATLTAVCMMAGIARGEDGAEDYLVPASYIPGEQEAAPEAPAPAANPDIHAESTADYD